MKAIQEKLKTLTDMAKANGLRLNFHKQGRGWIAKDFKGRQIWGGTFRDMRRVSNGK